MFETKDFTTVGSALISAIIFFQLQFCFFLELIAARIIAKKILSWVGQTNEVHQETNSLTKHIIRNRYCFAYNFQTNKQANSQTDQPTEERKKERKNE